MNFTLKNLKTAGKSMKIYFYLFITFLIIWGNVNAAEQVNTVSFNGTSQYLKVSDGVTAGLDETTISVWAYFDSLTDQDIYHETTSTSNYGRTVLRYNSGTVQIGMRDADTGTFKVCSSTSGLSTGQWYHIVGVIDTVNDEMKIYINSAHNNTESVSMNSIYSGGYAVDTSVASKLTSSSTVREFDGALSQLIVSNKVLSSTEISEIYNSGTPKQPWLYSQAIRDSYVLALPLNDGTASGREFEDFSGKENNPTLVGSPTLTGSTLDVEAGQVYNSFSFDGSSEYLSSGNNSSLDLTTGISQGCWFKVNNSPNTYNRLLNKYAAAGNRSWGTYFEASSNKIFAYLSLNGTSAGSDIINSQALNRNEWYHYLFTYDGSIMKLYINGEETATHSTTGTLFTSTAPVNIGYVSSFPSEKFKGDITAPVIFNRALTATEVKTLYNKNLPKKFSELPASLTDDAVLALELNSNDNSLIDLSGNNNDGTANGGVTSDGSEIDFVGSLIDPADLANTTTGHNAGTNNTGINNTFLGSNAGYNNTSGEGNVFIGSYAGADETGSNKLYIANSNTATPLIYGEFDNQKLQVNGELRVTGGILANKVHVKLAANWPDYVFAKEYKLLSLDEVEQHINEHKHLPGIPSAKEIENGTLSIDEVMVKQMEKIEELTLYILKLKKENKANNDGIEVLLKQNEAILNRLNALEKEQK